MIANSPQFDDQTFSLVIKIWHNRNRVKRSYVGEVLMLGKSLRVSMIAFFLISILSNTIESNQGIPLYYWQEKFINFGDYISLKIVERMVARPVDVYQKGTVINGPKLLAVGSIMTFARDGDIIWGSGVNGKWLNLKYYRFKSLDVRAVRGPLTRAFLQDNFGIACPEIYGDPALLMPYLFPELKRKQSPSIDYLIIPHYTEIPLFPKKRWHEHIVYPTEPWLTVVEKILDSKFVISSSLHGIIIAEAFGIPARLLKVTDHEPIFKYDDYYQGTSRPDYTMAHSVEEALAMGGERPAQCDLAALYRAFPFEQWIN